MDKVATQKRDIASGRLSNGKLADNFLDLHPQFNAGQASVEAARCLFCFDAPCTEACPTGIDIPGFIRKISSGNVSGAAVTILSENIMGGTCANVCPVEVLCEQVCVKNTSEEKPVTIGRLQRYATDIFFESGSKPFQRAASTGRRVAVVGAGPAGLSCAHRLAMLGHEVCVYEARSKPGGLNEYGIAAYKMNDQRAAREVEFILSVGGIEVRTGQALGFDFSLAQLSKQYDAVFLAVGHNGVNELGMEEETASGMGDAIDYIAHIRQKELASLPVGCRVIVIGGGSTAIDMAVQIRLMGAESVSLVYRRGRADMSATEVEQALALSNGVVIHTWANPHQAKTSEAGVGSVIFERNQTNGDGRLIGSGEFFELQADQVFKAIGQHFDPSRIDSDDFPEVQDGRIVVDEMRRTSMTGVWAGGDCVPGQDLTVVAVQDGKIAAESIHASFGHHSADEPFEEHQHG